MSTRLALRRGPAMAGSAALLAGLALLATLAAGREARDGDAAAPATSTRQAAAAPAATPVAAPTEAPTEAPTKAPAEAPTKAPIAAPLEPRHWDDDDGDGEGRATVAPPVFSSTSYRRCSAS